MASETYDVDILKRIEDELLDDSAIAENLANVKFDKEHSDIRSFFADRHVLVTGATGFLGKVIVEKLMRSCPEVGQLYLLVREKKGKTIHERVDEMFEDPVFQVLKKEQPNVSRKVHAIQGDVSLPGLGIDYQNVKLILERVSVIVHSAATIKFNEKLRSAVSTNVVGTRDLLNIAKQCKHLKSFVYVSTAYSHCPKTHIDEKLYDPPMKTDDLIKLVEEMPEAELNSITASLLGDFPNTYAYTKAVAEDAVQQYGQGLPVCVFRPSIVIATYREPVRGWIDNLYGPTGVAVGAGLGILKSLHGDEHVVADMIPVDLVVNALISAAWLTANKHGKDNKNDIQVFNYVSSCQKPITWGEYVSLNKLYGLQVPSIKAIWYYSFTMNKNKYVDLIYRILFHYLPAILFDTFSIITMSKPKLFKMYTKIHEFCEVISYFTMKCWKFSNTNVISMWDQMNSYDKRLFNFDVSQIDWDYHSQTQLPGIRVYVVKEDLSNLPEAKAKWQRLKLIHIATKVVGCIIATWFVYVLFSKLFNF